MIMDCINGGFISVGMSNAMHCGKNISEFKEGFFLMRRRELDSIVIGISSFHVSLLACSPLSGLL